MPTLLTQKGFRFFFYSNENNEPIHVHVEKGYAGAKVWLEPEIKVAYCDGFTTTEEREILEIMKANFETFKTKWNEHFTK